MKTLFLVATVVTVLFLSAPQLAADDGDILNSTMFPGTITRAITMTPLDLLYVPEVNGTTTYIYNLDLNITGFVDSPADQILGIAYVDPPGPAVASLFYLDGDGILYVTDLGGILLNSYSLISPFGGTVRGLTWDPGTNRMWAADTTNSLYFEFFLDAEPTGNIFFPPSGTFVGGINKIGGGSPCFDISVGDGNDNFIARVMPDGEVQGTAADFQAAATYPSLAWHATGSTGTEVVYVTDPINPAILEIELGLPCGNTGSFIRGDCDGDGNYVPLVDAVYLLDFGFTGGPVPPCEKSADADGNGAVTPLVDGLYVLTHGFTGGPPPPAPHPGCGDDGSSLSCDDTSGCDP